MGTVAVGQTIDFTGPNGWLGLLPSQFAGLIDDFFVTETIELNGISTATSAIIRPGNTLEITSLQGTFDLRLDPNDDYTGAKFFFGTSGDGDITLTTDLACFAPGTGIATPSGRVVVEALRVGDLVVTADGRAMPVQWLGHQTVSTHFADPLRVLPIRITAGALADNQPVRDLLVSPDHAMFVDGVLIQAGALVNGTTIRREPAAAEVLTYYHVELSEHALILAEGAPAETFVDNIDRLGFDNWAEHTALYPDGQAIEEMALPRAKSHRQVPMATRRRLAARAAMLAPVQHAA
ncbi:MAG: Hint domain-containing protein [Proteobacteria bacterium]|nr:Hint domain-containing protein [Pseudomonadota bacterium]